ncbi:YIP1 family protein [Halococcus sediminicola]|uniref:YIP1 family protein n=1 Tax=Halococcus sediminicola TaxID=1264579 RepID=UPI000678DF7B|nr:YIP1 family protein [Halococcus sediminicola]
MTQWVENPTGGRDRGPVALARAWFEALVRPRRFFATGVAPGDQAPGLAFVMTVVAIEEAARFALVPGAYPVLGGRPVASALLALLIAVGFVAPLALHLAAAIQTLALVPVASERAGVSETVQVIAYASAPCVLAGLPVPALRVACALYGWTLLVVGTSEVHGIGLGRAALAAAIPGLFVFGYAFRGVAAATALVA